METRRLADLSSRPETGSASRAIGWFLFCSGAAALVFQALWIKQLSLVVGVDVYAITIAISAFFAGLALGGALLGRKADGTERPLHLYGLLELGVGLSGIGTTIALAHSSSLFAKLNEHNGPIAWALPFALIGLPALLMGGTLPVMVRACLPQAGELGRTGGALYAANTVGGIAGALIAAFVLIPALGVRGTGLAAGSLNITLAVAALVMGGGARTRAVPDTPTHTLSARAGHSLSQTRLALCLYAVAGGIALGYEVVWSQIVVQFTSTRAFSFAIVLATYLAGLAAGSALYARWRRHARDPWSVFGLLIAAAGLVALLEITCLGEWLVRLQGQIEAIAWAATRTELFAMCARFLVAGLAIVFLPTVLLGAAFPAALQLIADGSRTGQIVGSVISLNTAGGVVGTILTGFLLVPRLGLVHTLGVLAIGAAAIGFLAVTFGSWAPRRSAWLFLGIFAATTLIAKLTPGDQVVRLLAASRGNGGEGLSFYEEDPGGTVAVIEQRSATANFRRLYIDGVSNSGDPMPSLRYMRLQALVPLIVHRGEPRSALVVGFGTGITTGALLQFPGLENRVCAELLTGVLHAAPLFNGNFGAASDPRIEVRVRDGRQELLRDTRSYDVITLEPPPPSAAGVVNLYSTDFYRLAKERLRPDGIFAQWLPLATQNDEDSRSLVRSFLDVFAHSSLWTTEIHETLLLGSAQPLDLDVPRIVQRFDQQSVASALQEVGIGSPAALMATWITGREGLERFAKSAAPVTDDRPRIEYARWLRRGEFVRVLPEVLALGTAPPLRNADTAFEAEMAAERSRLLDFYAAALHAYRGERDLWEQSAKRVFESDGGNPYYRWTAGVPTR
jgi:spermidine synthase